MAGDDFAARWPHEFDVSVNLEKVIFMISDSVTQPVLPDAARSIPNDYRCSVDPRMPWKGSGGAKNAIFFSFARHARRDEICWMSGLRRRAARVVRTKIAAGIMQYRRRGAAQGQCPAESNGHHDA